MMGGDVNTLLVSTAAEVFVPPPCELSLEARGDACRVNEQLTAQEKGYVKLSRTPPPRGRVDLLTTRRILCQAKKQDTQTTVSAIDPDL
jgi:hypothetical protein